MHHSNYFYGHAHIFARYCGMNRRRPPMILGSLQHGWNHVHGFGFMHDVPQGHPKFVWSEAVRRRGWAQGWRDYYVIGAPWIYLLAMRPELDHAPERKGTIWYPFHGWEHNEVAGDHHRLIAEIKETEEEPVTVCLYWLEYRDEAIRSLYESAGFRVISHGYRGTNYRQVSRRFLDRQLRELRAHRRVASNRISSAVLYGTLAGCEPAVYGDPMVFVGGDPRFGDADRTQRLRPEFCGHQVDVPAARAAAEEELGSRFLASPEEIRQLFGWSKGGRRK